MEKIVVEIELSEESLGKLADLIEARCLDREKYLKKLLTDSIDGVLKKRDEALARIKRASDTTMPDLQGKPV
jgi:hypothetical protein